MKKASVTTDTRDQLRALMARHSEKPAAQQGTGANEERVGESKRAPNDRCTVRLLPEELHRVNAIIGKAISTSNERLTVTDVLRVGLQRLDPDTPLSEKEISMLRASDGRRSKRPNVR